MADQVEIKTGRANGLRYIFFVRNGNRYTLRQTFPNTIEGAAEASLHAGNLQDLIFDNGVDSLDLSCWDMVQYERPNMSERRTDLVWWRRVIGKIFASRKV